MRAAAFALIVMTLASAASSAWACKPVMVDQRFRQFAMSPPTDAMVFTGQVIAVNVQRLADGDVITETTYKPTRWWRGFSTGAVVVRIVEPAGAPCSGGPRAVVGEEWLMWGTSHRTLVDSRYLLDGMSLEQGRVPGSVERELRRLEAR